MSAIVCPLGLPGRERNTFDSRYLEAYIDACEAIRLSPNSPRAYELSAVALCMMGYVERGKEVYKKVHELDPTYGQLCPGFDLNVLLGMRSPSLVS